MLLYVTTDDPKDRKPRPLHTIPETVNLLYDLGMREHDRAALLLHREAGGWADTPDWRFDRDVIRIALFAQERLMLHGGDAVAIAGPVSPPRLASEFATLGLGAVAVGLSADAGDDELAAVLSESKARLAFTADGRWAARLLALRFRAPSLREVVGPGGAGEGVISLAQLMEYGATLDTAERATRFREIARNVDPDRPACVQAKPGGGLHRLTHREAMVRVRERLVRMGAEHGDVAYFEPDAVSLGARLATYALVGDGYTTLAFGEAGRTLEDLSGLRPTRLLASPALLQALWDRLEASPRGFWESLLGALPLLSRLAGRARRRRLREALAGPFGERMRFLEPLGALPPAVARGLAEAACLVEGTEPLKLAGSACRENAGGPPSAGDTEAPRLRPETTT